MVKCPKCKEKISGLLNVVSGSMGYRYWLDEEDGSDEYEHDEQEFIPDGNVNEFWCPECNTSIFSDEDKARTFLFGGLPKKTKLKLIEGGI